MESVDFYEYARCRAARNAQIRSEGYPILSPPLIEALLPCCPLLEVGAGTGALASAVKAAGGRIVASDNYTTHGKNGWHGSRGRVLKAEAGRAVRLLARTRGVNLLCSWPSYDDGWCYRAVRLLPRGRLFAYVGEGPGGCTGDDDLHRLLYRDFDLMSEVIIPVHEFMHDRLFIYRRASTSE